MVIVEAAEGARRALFDCDASGVRAGYGLFSSHDAALQPLSYFRRRRRNAMTPNGFFSRLSCA